MTLLLDLLYGLAVCLGWPYLLYRRWKRGPSDIPFGEYFGRVPSRPVSATCVWIHGVSLGEINATRTIVEELRRRSPDTAVVISSTTRTGLARARDLYPRHLVFRFPLDFSFALHSLMTRVRPSVIVLMELEIWPNLLEVAAARGIPVLIANGRVTAERSVRRFNWPIVRFFARRMFRRLRWVGAQDATYASRFIELGVPAERIHVTGSIKYDAADTDDHVAGDDELAEAMGIRRDQPLWVCGSTGPGEEAIILDTYGRLLSEHADLQLAIIPRKPERFDEVAELIVQRLYACLRRKSGAPYVPPGVLEPRPVLLGDTMGELRKFYALATVVFVGRTLVPLGGSDVMEVAGLAKPIIVGPHTDNFTEAVNLLLAEGALRRISSPASLGTVVSELLRHPERREQMGRAGRQTIISRRGASKLTVDRILELLP
ncbi:MAG: glycosyltransferase N-terminal domain-containing protein [Phycisphaerae bacterium]|jgi:3-deoxy-D-manno-octulosonic-acid transferase